MKETNSTMSQLAALEISYRECIINDLLQRSVRARTTGYLLLDRNQFTTAACGDGTEQTGRF